MLTLDDAERAALAREVHTALDHATLPPVDAAWQTLRLIAGGALTALVYIDAEAVCFYGALALPALPLGRTRDALRRFLSDADDAALEARAIAIRLATLDRLAVAPSFRLENVLRDADVAVGDTPRTKPILNFLAVTLAAYVRDRAPTGLTPFAGVAR